MNFIDIFHHWLIIYCINHFLAIVILSVLSPMFCWFLEYFPSSLWGKSVPSLTILYKRAGKEFKIIFHYGVSSAESLALASIMIIFLLLPSFSLLPNNMGEFNPLPSDIMLLGGILIFTTGCLKLYPPLSVFFGSIFILCLIEAILILAAPGINGFYAISEAVHLLPDSGIIGASLCYGLAFMILSPLPRLKNLEKKWWQQDILYHENKERRFILMMFIQTGWLLFFSDLFLPEFIHGDGFLSLFGFLLRIFIILALMMLISLLNIERNLRIIFLLSGLGILLALAGRFAV